MPDVVIVVEVEQFALSVEVTRGCGREDPAGGLVDEEVESPGPGDAGHQDVDGRLSGDPLAVPQLHQDVEARVEEEVDDQNKQQEAGEVSALGSDIDNLKTRKMNLISLYKTGPTP